MQTPVEISQNSWFKLFCHNLFLNTAFPESSVLCVCEYTVGSYTVLNDQLRGTASACLGPTVYGCSMSPDIYSLYCTLPHLASSSALVMDVSVYAMSCCDSLACYMSSSNECLD